MALMRSCPAAGRAGLLAATLFVTSAHAQLFTWANGGGGNWNTGANWSPVGVPDGAGESALINLGGTFTIIVNTGPTTDSIQLLSTGGTIDVANASSLNIGGAAGLTNNGLIRINATAGFNFTSLRFNVPAPLAGNGTVRLNASANLSTSMLETTGAGVIQHQAPHIIAGTGRIFARTENGSLIVADVPGATLEIAGSLTQSGAGNLRADPGIISLGSGADLVGGAINGFNGGTWSVTSSPSISGVTSNATGTVLNNSVLRLLAGGMTNNAVLNVNNASGTNFTRIRIDEACTLGGVGSVNLRSTDNLDTAYFESANANAILTQGAAHSITGSGRVYAPMVNQGTIRATVPGRALEVRSSVTQLGAGAIVGDNADAALGTGASIVGGAISTIGTGRVRVTGEGAVSGITNLGLLTLDNNTILRFGSGGVNNSGVVNVNTTAGINFTRIRVENACAITGSGSISLNAQANLDTAYIESSGVAAVLTQGSGHTIRGTGRIYAPVDNNGVIRADIANKFLEIRSEIRQTANGTVEGSPGIAALGAGALIRGGKFNSVGAGVVRSTGNSTVDGVTNNGTLHVGNNTRVGLIGGGIINQNTINVNDGAGINFTYIAADAATSITGAGTLILRAIANPDTAYIDGLANGLTNGPLHTITGNGRLYGKITNQGKIKGSTIAGEIVRIRAELTQTGAGALIGAVGGVGLESGAVIGGSFESDGGPVRVLSGTSSATGVINKGTLQIENNGALVASSLVNNGTIRINDGTGGNFTSLTFPGVQALNGIGEIILRATANLDTAYIESTGVGSMLFLGADQTLRGSGRAYSTLVNAGRISPGLSAGAIGRIEPRGQFTLTSESRLEIDAVGDAPGQFDVIASSAPIALGGSLAIDVIGWSPANTCASFDFLTATSITGEFASFTLNAPPPPLGRVWRLDYQANKVSLRLTCPADFSGDCVVDDGDFTRFVAAYNLLDCADPAMPPGCPSDLNFDGVVDDSDFTIWIVAYNALLCSEG